MIVKDVLSVSMAFSVDIRIRRFKDSELDSEIIDDIEVPHNWLNRLMFEIPDKIQNANVDEVAFGNDTIIIDSHSTPDAKSEPMTVKALFNLLSPETQTLVHYDSSETGTSRKIRFVKEFAPADLEQEILNATIVALTSDDGEALTVVCCDDPEKF